MSGQFAQQFPPLLEGPLDPSDVDDVLFDFTDSLDGKTISLLNSVTVSPNTLTLKDQQILPGKGGADTGVGVEISKGTAQTQYTITAQVVTSDNRTLNRSLVIFCAYR